MCVCVLRQEEEEVYSGTSSHSSCANRALIDKSVSILLPPSSRVVVSQPRLCTRADPDDARQPRRCHTPSAPPDASRDKNLSCCSTEVLAALPAPLQDKQQSLRRPLGKPRDRRRPDRQKERLVGYFIQRLAKCLEKRGLDSPETTRTARMHAHTLPPYLHTTPALQFQPVESHKGLETLSRGR